ncbi:MAG TPA: ATP-binding protein [Vicinamibacteria bacterium]|nr:ATP-binding protein [Vicinamibacteria bacterium]
MARSPRSLLHSLSVRLLLPLLGILTVVLAVHSALSFRSTEKQFVELVGVEAHRLARVILSATHDRMLVDRQVDVQRTIQQLAEGGGVTRIRLYDAGGRIAQSTVAAEIGARVQRQQQPCLRCHSPRLRPAARDRQADFVTEVSGRPALRHLSVIPNQASCASASCHASASAQPVLGVLDVELSMGPLAEALDSARRRTLGSLAVLLLLAGSVSTVLIRRLVQRPIDELQRGTRRIARGEMDGRIEVRGRHELAELAEEFNWMAAEVKAAREEVTGWSRRLEEKVVEKGDELRRAQRQVLHMERMASLGKLAATVAHEINNPLSGILGTARLVERELEDQPLPPDLAREVTGHLRLIAQECARCGTIVRNLLLFARHSGGAMAPVDVNEVAERSLMLMRHHLEMHNVELQRELLAGDAQVVADGAQLQQALLALLVNAVEAMGSGSDKGGTLGLRIEGDAQAVTFHVSDTGVGIHPEVLPHIFEPFFSTKHQESGVGLGLAVVYGIVQRHGGTIAVDSERGRGTTFHVRVPRQPAAEGSGGAAPS